MSLESRHRDLATRIADEFRTLRSEIRPAVGDALGSILVKDYLTVGATAAQNTTAIQTALNAAASTGRAACFDGVDVTVNGEFTISTPGMRLWSSTVASCRITQTSVLTGKGIFRVTANNVTIDGFTLNSTLTLDAQGRLNLNGLSTDVHHASAIKVDPGVKQPTIRNITGDGWFILLAGFPYPIGQENSAAPETYQYIEGLIAENITASNVWAAVRMSGLKGALYRNVRGSYVIANGHTQADTAPPHLFYISMPTIDSATPKAYNQDVRIQDCHAYNGPGGAPFSLRYTEGMTWSNLTADNCEGLVDMLGVRGFTTTGGHSMRDKYPKSNLWNGDRGSFALQHCYDGDVGPFVIEGATDFDHGSLVYVGSCQNISMTQPKGWVDLATADGGLRLVYLSGTNVRVVRPEISSRGAAAAMAFLIATGFNNDSTVHLDDPRTMGTFYRDMDLTPTTTKSTITYHPERLAGANQSIRFPTTITVAGTPRLINLRDGYPPEDEDPRIIAWFNGERLGDNGQLRARWPSGHMPNIHTDAWVTTATPPIVAGNNTVTGLMCADVGAANVEITCKVKHGSGSVGLAFRAVDTNNFLQVVITATTIVLAKRVAGTYTTLVSVPLPESGSGIWHNLKVRAVGSRITAWLDDTQAISHVLTAGDATTFTSPTSHGLRSDNGGANSGWYGLRIKQL